MTDDYKGVYSFARMWDLVDTMINWDFPKELTRYRAAFSDEMISAELLMAIFWEETKFQNIGQEPAGPAIGFGQVEEATRKRTLHYFNNEDDNGRSMGEPRIPGGLKESEWTKKTIVEDEHKSVMLPMLLLTHLWEVKSKSLMGLLRIYAGYDEVPKSAPQFLEPAVKAAGGDIKEAWHNQRQALIDGWLACRDELRRTPIRRKPEILGQRSDEALKVIRQLIHALGRARPFCNICYDAFDPKARPPVSPPQFVLPLIVKLFPNVTVKHNPKTMFKWGPDRPQVAFV